MISRKQKGEGIKKLMEKLEEAKKELTKAEKVAEKARAKDEGFYGVVPSEPSLEPKLEQARANVDDAQKLLDAWVADDLYWEGVHSGAYGPPFVDTKVFRRLNPQLYKHYQQLDRDQVIAEYKAKNKARQRRWEEEEEQRAAAAAKREVERKSLTSAEEVPVKDDDSDSDDDEEDEGRGQAPEPEPDTEPKDDDEAAEEAAPKDEDYDLVEVVGGLDSGEQLPTSGTATENSEAHAEMRRAEDERLQKNVAKKWLTQLSHGTARENAEARAEMGKAEDETRRAAAEEEASKVEEEG